jgi:hypothetical protein
MFCYLRHCLTRHKNREYGYDTGSEISPEATVSTGLSWDSALENARMKSTALDAAEEAVKMAEWSFSSTLSQSAR